EARGHPRVAGDVAALFPRLCDATSDDVVDALRVDAGAIDESLQRERQQVARVPTGKCALALGDRRAHGVDDDRLADLHARAYLRGMDRADLELVVAIARTGSLTAAARELHMAQPPLSRRLQHLERDVGAPLFLRGRHGAVPTAVGRTLVDAARDALKAIARAEQDTADAAAGRAGRLRIGVTPTLGAVLLPAVLAAFRRAHPGVRLDLTSSGDSAWLRQQAGA